MTTPAPTALWLRPQEVAELLQIGESTVSVWVQTGVIPAPLLKRHGQVVRIHRAFVHPPEAEAPVSLLDRQAGTAALRAYDALVTARTALSEAANAVQAGINAAEPVVAIAALADERQQQTG
jgi:excisionase family DNA binding protein